MRILFPSGMVAMAKLIGNLTRVFRPNFLGVASVVAVAGSATLALSGYANPAPPAAQVPTVKPPTGGGTASTNRNRLTPDQREILKRLDRITVPEVRFHNVPLKNVVEELADLVRRNDPFGRGVDFFLHDASDSTGPPLIDAVTGLPIEPMRLSEVPVVVPSMRDADLSDVLEAVVNGAVFPIRYTVEDRGVVFAYWTNSTEPLWTGTFKMDMKLALPNAARWLGDAAPKMETNALVPSAIRQFLSNSEVDLAPPASIAWNAEASALVARAPRNALVAIETATQILNRISPRLAVEVKVYEVTGRGAESFNPLEILGLPGNGGTNAAPTVLTAPQYHEALRRLQQRPEAENTAARQVLMPSEQEAQFSLVAKTNSTQRTPAPNSRMVSMEDWTNLVTRLGVQATVFPDETTILVQATIAIKTFVGYDTSPAHRRQYDYIAPPNIDPARMHETLPPATPERPTGSNVPRAPIRNQEPMPVFRLRQTVANATVWDGQTMVLSRMATGSPMGSRTGAPATNTLPLVGRLFRSESFGPRNSLVLIFITPTIIDPAGNRVHSDKDLPFARTNVPPQTGIK